MQDVVKKKSYLKYKVPMFLLSIGYIVYFIYLFLTKDYDFNKTINIIKLVGLFLLVFILGLTSLTNSKLTIFFSIIGYLLITSLVILNLNIKIPKINNSKEAKTNSGKITCKGKTDTSDNTTIDIDYKKDKINTIIYTYRFDIKNKTGAENLVNHFDKSYIDYNNIYSEITISNDVEVKFYYNLDNIDINKIKEINDKITDSYKEFKKNELSSLECKTRD